MRKFVGLFLCIALAACAEKDPILPGVRTAVFDTPDINVINENVPDLPENIDTGSTQKCPYRQDTSNVIWDGDKKIFSGFPTNNCVKSVQQPVCSGKYVYAGLTTGELVKINTKTREIMWIADIYRASNMTGGASVLDIVAPVVVYNNDVYVSGLGDAFCRLNTKNGIKKWCVNIATSVPFIVTDVASFIVATDDMLYAVRNSDGAIFWRTKISKQSAPVYQDKIITVNKLKIDAQTGKIISR